MANDYANEKLATALKNHLLSVDAVPPTAEASKPASNLARICLTQLDTAAC